MSELSPFLRIFEGCERGYIGRIDGTNLIKLSRREPKIAYLSYPEFEQDPHPALATSVTVHFQTFNVRFYDYRDWRNPPILHREETFLAASHPLYAKFAGLTRIEEGKGLYENSNSIGTQDGWNAILEAGGLRLQGIGCFRGVERPESPAGP
jgi:DNA phosphorothioation-associated putative methyltransferase